MPTLVDYEEYLDVNSKWDASINASSMPSRPSETTVVNRTVGLLNSYEFYTTYNQSDGLAEYKTGYLFNGTIWFLMTPDDQSCIYDVTVMNGFSTAYTSSAYGVRPSVNLKSNIQIISGDGTEASPYRLQGDSRETINGTTLINTRNSGEYIKFDNELYRIVGVENNLTKVTSVEQPAKLNEGGYVYDSSTVNFASSYIKTRLENYYQSLDAKVKNMVEENTTWYLGTVGNGSSYKAGICATVDVIVDTKACSKTTTTTTANIGLPRVGEMFVAQISRGQNDSFWLLTPSTTARIHYLTLYGQLYDTLPSESSSVHISLYLKRNVVIASTNTGDGTYEHPYDIELNE